MKKVCVYCGSSSGSQPEYEQGAKRLAHALAEQNLELVYGGGNVGLMGVIADAVLEAGGRVTGVIPSALMEKEVGHEGLSQLHVVADMHERKAMMSSLSDGFIAMPGGWGTLEELFEMLTWLQLGFHTKPCALYNVNHYYDSLQAFLANASEQGFVKPLHHSMILSGEDAGALLEEMAAFKPPQTNKWIGFGE